jgi:hypothetical protein
VIQETPHLLDPAAVVVVNGRPAEALLPLSSV